MRRWHPGKRLEGLLQLTQGNPGNIRQLHQVERLLRAVGRPLAHPAHDRPFLVTPAQRHALQALAGVVEDEQAVLQQLLRQGLPLQRAIRLAQAGQCRAQPTAEQRILPTAQRHHEQPFQALRVKPMTGQESLVEHDRHFLVVLRGDPDVAALLVQQIQAVFAAVEAERQRTAGCAEKLLHPGVQPLLVHLHPVKPQATQFTAEMPRRHLPVLLLPARGGTYLFGHVGGVESLDLQGIGGCHARS